MINNIIFQNKSDNWRTPSSLYNLIVKEYHYYDLFEYFSTLDQYDKTYYNSKLFINPPYSHINKFYFLDYLKSLLDNNNLILLLIPSRTDTRIYQWCLQHCLYVYFFEGRLHFNDSKRASTFPSSLLLLKKCKEYSYPRILYGKLEHFIFWKGQGILAYGESIN